MRLLFFILGLWCLSSCAEDAEGCLDADAVNFDITADQACGSCCTFPSFSFSINHKIVQIDTTINMQLDSFYVNNVGSSFAINDMKFFISNVELLQTDGTAIGIEDTIQLNACTSGTTNLEILTDDFMIVKRSAFDYTAGTLNASGDFSGFRFDVGLSSTANSVVAEDVAETHPLGLTSDSLYVDKATGYRFQKISLATDEQNPDILTDYSITGNNNKITVSFPVSFSLEKGLNTGIGLDVDYLTFFQNINFAVDNKATIHQKIIQNTPLAIQLSN